MLIRLSPMTEMLARVESTEFIISGKEKSFPQRMKQCCSLNQPSEWSFRFQLHLRLNYNLPASLAVFSQGKYVQTLETHLALNSFHVFYARTPRSQQAICTRLQPSRTSRRQCTNPGSASAANIRLLDITVLMAELSRAGDGWRSKKKILNSQTFRRTY